MKMGNVKELMNERRQEESDKKLSLLLGITYVELMSLNYRINTEESNDGGLIYNYILCFSDDSPKSILKKIKGIDDNNMVWLQPCEYEDRTPYD